MIGRPWNAMQDKIHRGWRGGGGEKRGQGLEMCMVVAVLASVCGLVKGSKICLFLWGSYCSLIACLF